MLDAPSETATALMPIPEGARLALETAQEDWGQVRYISGTGVSSTGWLPLQCLVASGICLNATESVTIRNNVADLTFIDMTFGDTTFSPVIDPGQSLRLPLPEGTNVTLDCYMGSPASIHFVFSGASFAKGDVMVLREEQDATPILELFTGEKSANP